MDRHPNSKTVVARKIICLDTGKNGEYFVHVKGIGYATIKEFERISTMPVRIYTSDKSSDEITQVLEAICANAPLCANACHIGDIVRMDSGVYRKATKDTKRANKEYLVSRRNDQTPNFRRVVTFITLPEETYKMAILEAANFAIALEDSTNGVVLNHTDRFLIKN